MVGGSINLSPFSVKAKQMKTLTGNGLSLFCVNFAFDFRKPRRLVVLVTERLRIIIGVAENGHPIPEEVPAEPPILGGCPHR